MTPGEEMSQTFDPSSEYLYMVRSALADGKYEMEWNHWYDYEHLPRIAATPGFISGTRYIQWPPTGRNNSYLTIYEVSGPAALTSEEYRHLPGWGKWRPVITGWHRGLYQLIANLEDRDRK
jgi:hypothetical protein